MPVSRPDDRALGVVYTPAHVAQAMVRLALEPLIAGRSSRELVELRVCDPAIGEGAFLVEVVDVLAGALTAAWWRETTEPDEPPSRRDPAPPAIELSSRRDPAPPAIESSSRRDPAPPAIESSSRRDPAPPAIESSSRRDPAPPAIESSSRRDLAPPTIESFSRRDPAPPAIESPHRHELAAPPPGPRVRGQWFAEARRRVVAGCIAGIDVDRDAVAAARARLGAGERALQVGDALELDWARAFPDVFAAGGFDAIVGNPPYIRQEWLAGKAALRGFASYDGVADLYVYFIELAHRIARRGGRYCLITPNKWLTAAYGRRLRTYLAAQGSVEGVVDLSRAPLFDGADAFPSIVWGRLGEPLATPIRAARVDAGVAVAEALRAGTPHARPRWRAEPWHIDSPRDRALIARLERAWPALGDVVCARPARGVVTGCNDAFVIDRATRDRLLADEPAAVPLIRPFVKGRDLRPWLPEPVERWILLVGRGTSLDELPAVAAHLARFRSALEPRPGDWTGAWRGRKPGSYRWYELQDPVGALAASRAPRLLYQDIQTGPACCLGGGELVPDTTVWILPTADRYLLAVLNSPLYAWYARRRFPPALNGAVRPKLDYIRALPIASPAPAARAAIEQLVDERLALALALALEPRAGDLEAARALDDAIAGAVLDCYELSRADRAWLATTAS